MSADVAALVGKLQPDVRLDRPGRIREDTSQFMDIGPGDVIVLAERRYLVRRDAVERSYNYEDTKFWVKKCLELESGQPKLLKLVFHESFTQHFGEVEVRCHRSPTKEARILDMVRGDERFMQGVTVNDTRGNPVRVVDHIRGKRLDMAAGCMDLPHHEYFSRCFPETLDRFITACEAIQFLHDHNERHGDICRDHLWVDRDSGATRWIDFDYAYETPVNPFGMDVFGLGGLLVFLAGAWDHTPSVLAERGLAERLEQPLGPEDFSLIHRNRLVNLRKIFPYIPEELNRVFMHFSAGTEVAYETAAELLEDLRRCRPLIDAKSRP